jgi:hypothetical protein
VARERPVQAGCGSSRARGLPADPATKSNRADAPQNPDQEVAFVRRRAAVRAESAEHALAPHESVAAGARRSVPFGFRLQCAGGLIAAAGHLAMYGRG